MKILRTAARTLVYCFHLKHRCVPKIGLPADISLEMFIEMSIDMFIDISVDILTDMSIDMLIDMFADISIDMFTDNVIDISINIFIDMFIDMYEEREERRRGEERSGTSHKIYQPHTQGWGNIFKHTQNWNEP